MNMNMNMKKSNQKGFTLIELMIVVAIIGILAAVAVPAYQDYIVRSKVSEGIVGASEFKTAISEYYSFRGVLPANNADAGLLSTAASYATDYVASIGTATNGVVTVTFATADELHDASATTIIYTPDATGHKLTWTCTDGTTPDNYRPSQCR